MSGTFHFEFIDSQKEVQRIIEQVRDQAARAERASVRIREDLDRFDVDYPSFCKQREEFEKTVVSFKAEIQDLRVAAASAGKLLAEIQELYASQKKQAENLRVWALDLEQQQNETRRLFKETDRTSLFSKRLVFLNAVGLVFYSAIIIAGLFFFQHYATKQVAEAQGTLREELRLEQQQLEGRTALQENTLAAHRNDLEKLQADIALAERNLKTLNETLPQTRTDLENRMTELRRDLDRLKEKNLR